MTSPAASEPAPVAPLRIVVLISGGGTTLKNLLKRIAAGTLHAEVVGVVSSNPAARGVTIATEAKLPTAVFERREHPTTTAYSQAVFAWCRQRQPHLVVMGGFLKLLEIPPDFALRVVNIHPSLIPAFCGHGFYGHHIHQAVLDYGAKVSGCTVHFVDNQYDHGPIILQKAVSVLDEDTAETLARRVFEAECQAYPQALELLAQGRVQCDGRRVRII